jgi:hypothetical protein
MSVYLIGVYLIGVHLMGEYLMGVYLMSVYLIGVYRDIHKSVAELIFSYMYELAVATPPIHHCSYTTYL